ncbi:MAG TPA: cupin domain-containing protein [Solirubrobacterales bacterium]|nr:cupin domain-containing protein [Solirubrobacterales bacterium]
MAGPDTFTLYDGSEMTVLERPGGPEDSLVMRFRLREGCGAPPPHTHPTATEIFAVEEGDFEMQLDGEWRAVAAGEAVEVEPGQVHTFRNETPGEVVIRNTHDPHHDFEPYIRAVAALSHDIESVSPNSLSAAARMAVLWQRHSDLIQPGPLPLKLAFPVLAGGAKLLRLDIPG